MNFPTEWTNKQMSQNTNQLKMVIVFYKLRNYNICEILLKSNHLKNVMAIFYSPIFWTGTRDMAEDLRL